MSTIFLSSLIPIDFSGIIAGLVLIGALLGVYIKQIKDIQELKLTLIRDKQHVDKEIELLKIELGLHKEINDKILESLNHILINQAVSDEKITTALIRIEKQENKK